MVKVQLAEGLKLEGTVEEVLALIKGLQGIMEPQQPLEVKAGVKAILTNETICTAGFKKGDIITVIKLVDDGKLGVQIGKKPDANTTRGYANVGYCGVNDLQVIEEGKCC